MSGLDVAAGVTGIAGFAYLALSGCMKGLLLLQAAKDVGGDLSGVALMFGCEHHKLHTWARAVGLFDEPPNMRLYANDLEQALQVMRHLAELLEDVAKLRSKYKLQIEITDEELSQLDTTSVGSSILLHDSQRQLDLDLARVFQNRQSIWRKLKWIKVDEIRCRKLVEQIKYFVEELRGYLDDVQKEQCAYEIHTILGAVVTCSKEQRHLSIASDASQNDYLGRLVSTAARARKAGLVLGVVDEGSSPSFQSQINIASSHLRQTSIESPEKSTMTSSSTIISRKLRKTDFKSQKSMSNEIYLDHEIVFHKDHKNCLIEWFHSGALQDHSINRINQVTSFLYELTDDSFHSLQCVGWIDYSQKGKYGFVFRIPPTLVHQNLAPVSELSRFDRTQCVTLKHMFQAAACPSLNRRLRLAEGLLEAMLQLHTTGWLHKGLRSENVISFLSREPTHQNRFDITQMRFFLAGYVQSRTDSQDEMTEPSSSALDATLYRHPESLGDSRTPYRKSFDVFSMGCILLEIGLWCSLSELLTDTLTATGSGSIQPSLHGERQQSDSRDLLRAKRKFVSGLSNSAVESKFTEHLEQTLAAATGQAFVDITMSCLKAAATMSQDDIVAEGHHIVELESFCLLRLRKIAANI